MIYGEFYDALQQSWPISSIIINSINILYPSIKNQINTKN
jgi:hypothetical protein